eukprot:1178270-Prorocentrum_minimum.AAC.1
MGGGGEVSGGHRREVRKHVEAGGHGHGEQEEQDDAGGAGVHAHPLPPPHTPRLAVWLACGRHVPRLWPPPPPPMQHSLTHLARQSGLSLRKNPAIGSLRQGAQHYATHERFNPSLLTPGDTRAIQSVTAHPRRA